MRTLRDCVALLLQIAPKDDEQKACEQYTGRVEDLSPPEQFLLTMSSVPRLHDKINTLILMQQFQVYLVLKHCLVVAGLSRVLHRRDSWT